MEEVERLRELLKLALTVFPDANREEDFEWCWNELISTSQEEVKTVRAKINEELGKHA